MRRSLSFSLTALTPLLATLALVPASHAVPADVDPDSFSRVWDDGPGGERYVALGDSFTSGPGISPQRPEGCSRSEKNFPSLFAATLDTQLEGGLTAYTDASCGGAQTKDLWEPQRLNADLSNDPQLDAVDADTTLVTFGTLGGNDIGLVQLAMGCFTQDCVPAAGADPLGEKFRTLESSLTRGISDVKAKAPKADVVVVGYGTYLPPGGCPATFGGALTVDEFAYVQGQIDRMSDTLARVADQQDVDFVDMRQIPGSVDRTVCATPTKQWIRAIATYDDGVVLHPSACGMNAMAQHLTRTLQGLRGQGLTPFDDSCVSAGPADPAPSPSPSVDPTPTPTPTPTATPAPAPAKDRATRRAELRSAATSLRGKVSCQGGQARFRLRGPVRHVERATFTVGGRKVAVDRNAPFRATLKKRGSARGAIKAKVVLRDGNLRTTRAVRFDRPGCLR